MKPCALITGITGQDGSYLAELLLEKGYTVAGISSGRSPRTHLVLVENMIEWHTGDITDAPFIREAIQKIKPNEIYNLASAPAVVAPWDEVENTVCSTAVAPVHILEAIREFVPKAHFFQASSAEIYADVEIFPQDEHTPPKPRNPYGISKLFAHQMVGAYRKNEGLHASSGILFNHESPRRGTEFITRKVTLSLAQLKLGLTDRLSCGNLDAKRDWGYAKEYVEAMWLMLQQEQADDFLLATGELHSVRQVIEVAAQTLGISLRWEGEGLNEVGRNERGDIIVAIDPAFYRRLERSPLVGDATKALEQLGWKPSTSFEQLVAHMAEADYNALITTRA